MWKKNERSFSDVGIRLRFSTQLGNSLM